MNDKPNWQVAHLDDLERRGRDIPIREHLGIHAFGINAYMAGEDGTLINEHDEAGSGQEELYILLDGEATFEADGETFEAPTGTFVSVRPESRHDTFAHLRRSVELLPRFREDAQRRRPRRRTRRPAIRAGASLSAQVSTC